MWKGGGAGSLLGPVDSSLGNGDTATGKPGLTPQAAVRETSSLRCYLSEDKDSPPPAEAAGLGLFLYNRTRLPPRPSETSALPTDGSSHHCITTRKGTKPWEGWGLAGICEDVVFLWEEGR